MNPARLYVHIGTHKTGSTAIQSALLQNVAALEKEGIAFMRAPKAAKLLITGKEPDARVIAQCRDSLHRGMRDHPRVNRFLWSFEGFSGNPETGYENAHAVAESLKKITDGLDVRIIAYLRQQDEFIESLYAQTICVGASHTFESFIEKFDVSSFDWARLLRCYAGQFGRQNVVARRYDRGHLSARCGLLGDFAQAIGSERLKNCGDTIIANRGYSHDALEIMRLAHPHLDDREKRRLQRALHQACRKQPFEGYSYLSPEKRQEILARYSASNAEVAREYFNEPAGRLFTLPNPSDAHPPYQGISEATIIMLARAVATEHGSLLVRTALKAEKRAISLLDRVPRVKASLKRLLCKLGLLHR